MTSEANTKLLTAALDRVLPPADDLPGAGSMGLAEEVIRRCAADPRFNNALETVLGALPGSEEFQALDGDGQDDAIRAVESSIPDAFSLWLDVVYTIYYMQPEVHRWLGFHGRPPQPDGEEMPSWDESVLKTIRQREPFWRQV